jgi:hypothetical protein
MVAAIYEWAIVATTPSHPGAIGLDFDALGTDFMVFWGGARWFFDGHLAALFDGYRFTAYLNATFAHVLSKPLPFRPWVYPPTYLLLLLPFGLLPFVLSYAVFEAASALLLAAVIGRGADEPTNRAMVIAAALLSPAAAVNVASGQNAFLIAALIVGGFRLLPRWPLAGGAVLGLLTVKPQFCLLVPIAIVAKRDWRALSGFVLGGLALALATAPIFGVDCWRHWLHLATSYSDPHSQWVQFGRLWGDSVYAGLIALGLPESVANGGQYVAILAGAALTWSTFRRDLGADRKIAIFLACTILAAPHSSLHDTVLLALAVALWAAEVAQEPIPLAIWNLALALWLAPLFNPPYGFPAGGLTPLFIAAFIGVMMARVGQVEMRIVQESHEPGSPAVRSGLKRRPLPRPNEIPGRHPT